MLVGVAGGAGSAAGVEGHAAAGEEGGQDVEDDGEDDGDLGACGEAVGSGAGHDDGGGLRRNLGPELVMVGAAEREVQAEEQEVI